MNDRPITTDSHFMVEAQRLAELGFPVFPCGSGEKKPLTGHGFLDATTDLGKIKSWWTRHPTANIGMPTAGLLVVDVDGAENPWPPDQSKRADLMRSVVSMTPRGGQHYIFRRPANKCWRNSVGKIAPHVDIRTDRGYIVVPPSVFNGMTYRWADATGLIVPLAELPEPPGWLIDLLDEPTSMLAVGILGDNDVPPMSTHVSTGNGNDMIPEGTRNNTLTRMAGGMRRVGMDTEEIIDALDNINRKRCQPPLAGDEIKKIGRSISRYPPTPIVTTTANPERGATPGYSEPSATADPGLLPDEAFRIPGFISEVMDHSLATAPYPNTVMAFAGALALLSVLTGRKVRDPGDNRTNLYLLALAHSAAGKDRPRKVNIEILTKIGMQGNIGGRFASGEGLQDALFEEPCILFQTDEIDGMLQSINKSKDARHENIMGSLLELYSSANSSYPMRRKAGVNVPGTIDQPHLVILGTAIPNHYYAALSNRMLTNGFFARMLVVECGTRSLGQEPTIKAIPNRIMETATWWATFRPGNGSSYDWQPVPKTISLTNEALKVLADTRVEADTEYSSAEHSGDAVGTTVWGRVNENTRKLALLYAASENHIKPMITKEGAEWATRVVLKLTRRMLAMAKANVAENQFDSICLKTLKNLRESPGGELPHSVLLKRMKVGAKEFCDVITTLEQRGDVEIKTVQAAGPGRPNRFYVVRQDIRGAR